MKKFKLFYDKDEETKWLNEMVSKGWAMKNFFLGVYTFEPCENGEYIYQVTLMENTGEAQKEFDEFMEDSGVEVVCHWYRWAILRKKSIEGSFEMFTDIESKIEEYKKIKNFFMLFTIAEALILCSEINIALSSNKWYMWSVVAFIGAIVFGMCNIIFKYNKKINELKKQM